MSYPHKPALNKYPLHQLIKNRWSPRLFANRLIEEAKVMSLFEAARWAPSSYNEQPWRFIYALKDNQQDFEKFVQFLNPGNLWAKRAPLLIVIVAKKNFGHNNLANPHSWYDAGAAAENLFLEAVNQGLLAHEMAGFNKDLAEKELAVPTADYQAVAMMAVGYPATLEDLDKVEPEVKAEELAPRSRLAFQEIVFKGGWKKIIIEYL